MIKKDKYYFVFKNEKGERYYGVNSLIKKHKDEQDWDEICRKTAAKRGVDPIELRAEWDEAARVSKHRGVLYHTRMEEKYARMDKPWIHITPSSQLIWKDQKLKNRQVYIEKLIWDDDYKVIGYPDYVQTKDWKINIIDYKTNKEIKRNNRWQSYNGELQHLDDCNFIDYALQLNMYMAIMLKNNPKFKMGKMIIEHAKFNDKDELIGTEKIEVPNLQKEIDYIWNNPK